MIIERSNTLSSRHHEMQSLIRHYKEVTGEKEVDMHKVAQFAVSKGWPLPQPRSALEMLAREFARAAREEIRHDEVTNRPYRVYHALPTVQGGAQLTLWLDIDEEVQRPKMLKTLINRREQMVGDGLQLTLDMDHWNRINPNEEPIMIPMDLTPDIEWRKNAPD
jgi:hypothetical protein